MRHFLLSFILLTSFSAFAREASIYTNSNYGETNFFGTFINSNHGESKIDLTATVRKEAVAIQVEVEHFYATGELTTSLEQRVENLKSNVAEFETASTEECVDELSLMAKNILSK